MGWKEEKWGLGGHWGHPLHSRACGDANVHPQNPPLGEKRRGQQGQQTEAPWGAGEEEPCTMSPAPVVSSFDFDE